MAAPVLGVGSGDIELTVLGIGGAMGCAASMAAEDIGAAAGSGCPVVLGAGAYGTSAGATSLGASATKSGSSGAEGAGSRDGTNPERAELWVVRAANASGERARSGTSVVIVA